MAIQKYKFGSFNLRNFGKTAIGKRDFEKIAEIIRKEKFDVVALQEILSEGSALKKLVHNLLPGWEIKWGEPEESSDYLKARDKRGEGFAFIWNTRRLSLATSSTEKGMRVYEPRSVNKALRYDCTMFARIPYYARFIPVNGGFFEFRLVNVHLHFGDNSVTEIEKRKFEYEFLTERIYPSISAERRYGNNREAYTIVMGDYNLNLYKSRGEAEKRINSRTYIKPELVINNQRILTVQDQLTTLKTADTDEYTNDDNKNRGYSQNYDHFTFDVAHFDADNIKYKYNRVDAVRKYCNDDFEMYRAEISDHIPIALEITMNSGGYNE